MKQISNSHLRWPKGRRSCVKYISKERINNESNAVNEDLKDIQKMVDVVKQDGEVSLQYMKSFEHDQLMYEEGRLAEIKNTEREKKRADMAQSRIKELEAELKKYRKKTTA